MKILIGLVALLALSQDVATRDGGLQGVLSNAERSPAPHGGATRLPECQHRYSYICTGLERTESRRETLDRQLTTVFWQPMNELETVTHALFNDQVGKSLVSAEEAVFSLTNVERDEVRQSLNESASRLIAYFETPRGRSLFGTGAVGRQRLERLTSRLERVELRYGTEFVETEAARRQAEVSGQNVKSVARAAAFNEYHSLCGRNGLEVAYFRAQTKYDPGATGQNISLVSDPYDIVVLCPGLIISMADHGAGKDEIIDALQFTWGILLGQIVSDEMSATWDGRAQLAVCYGDDFTFDSAELLRMSPAADVDDFMKYVGAECWGAHLLGQALSTVPSLQRRTKVTATALHAVCREMTGMPVDALRFRMRNIGSNPTLAASLTDVSPSADRPYCSTTGT